MSEVTKETAEWRLLHTKALLVSHLDKRAFVTRVFSAAFIPGGALYLSGLSPVFMAMFSGLLRLKVTSPSLVFCCACWNIGIPHFIVIFFITLHRYYVFYRLEACGNSASSKSIGAIFPTACVDFVSVIFEVTTAKRLRLANGSNDDYHFHQ